MSERFKTFSNDENVSECRKEAVPKNTRKHTSWGVNVYTEWARNRNEAMKDFRPENAQYAEAPEDLSSLRIDEINYWVSKFCVDARQKNGEEYRHEVLYSLFCAINRVIRQSHPDLVLFKSPQLKPLQDVLDSRLKELQSKQTPFRKKAKALSGNDEEKLWSTGSLGTQSPRVLVDTLIFLAGKIFALRGGQEHRSLSFDSFEFTQSDDGKTIVTYREKTSKVNQGGLKRRKCMPKVVTHIEDGGDERSFTYIFNFYISKCPTGNEMSVLYLKPKIKWDYAMECWYENRPVGHNTLASTYKRICELAGLQGQYSNHSGRATAATALLKAGVPDKMALGRTGHRTLESLREYQTLDINDTKRVSDVLSSCTNNSEVCDKQELTCLTNINSLEKKSSEIMFPECDVDDIVLSQAVECYESSVIEGQAQSSSSVNFDLNGFISNCNIGTLNVFVNKQ